MKTLKKNLCLVLAMVMLFGLCTISASAKLEYNDNNAITYKEAVDVLSGLGILVGSNGQFRPTANITRAEAAKILAYIMIGNSEQADALKASTAPFTDVPATHWAAGYIAYCNSRGIILGVGDGSYRPNSNVTNIQFALMLLRALGYGTQKEYSGSDWTIKVAADAIRLGVFDDNIAGANANAATREACALYAFNVIAKERDEDVWGLKKVTYSALAGGYVANGAFSGIGGTGISVDANKKPTFAEDFGLKSREVGEDAFGREIGHCWVQTIGNSTTVISGEYADAGKQIALYTTGVTGKDIYNLLVDKFGKSVYDEWFKSGDLDIYRNSATAVASISDFTPNFAKANVVRTGTDTLGGTGNGVQTYVYAKLDSHSTLPVVKVVIIDTYMVKVNTVTKGTDKKDPSTTVTTLGTTMNKQNTTMGSLSAYATDEFEKGDYVLITVADDKIQSMEAVNVRETEVTFFDKVGSNISIVAGGTTYTPAKDVASETKLTAANAITKTIVDGKNHKVYTDNYGYVIAVADVDETSEYVYAARVGNMTGHSSDFDDENIGVQVYYADGTSKVLPLKTDEKNMGVTSSTSNTADTYASHLGVYKLVMKSGKAVLLDKDPAATGNDLDNETPGSGKDVVKKGLPSLIEPTTTTGAKVDNDTVFFYVKWHPDTSVGAGDAGYYKYSDAEFKVTPYIGINNVPANKDGTGAIVETLLITDKSAATKKIAAVLVKDTLAGDVTDTVYMLTGNYNVSSTGWTVTYEAYVNGETQPIVVSYDTEAKKDTGVETFMGTGNANVKKFITLDAKGEPSLTKPAATVPGTTALDKMYYVSDEAISSASDITDYEITVNSVTYSIDGIKVIDLTGNNLTTLDLIKDALTNSKTVKVGVQANENMAVVCLYVTSVTG